MIQLLSTCDAEGCRWSATYGQHRVDAAVADLEAHRERRHGQDTAEKILADLIDNFGAHMSSLSPYVARARNLGILDSSHG